MLSFDGDLLHGGDPITWGVRYVVVAFTYIDPPHPLDTEDVLRGVGVFEAREGGRVRGLDTACVIPASSKRAKMTDASAGVGAGKKASVEREGGFAVDWSDAGLGNAASFSFGF